MRLSLGKWIAIGSLAGLAACSSTYNRPLAERGLPVEERHHFVVQNGYGIPESVRQAFLTGYVVEGMTKELVFQLYGAPDRTADADATWEYLDRKGALVTGMKFAGEKIETVYGDPRGGYSPEPKN